MGAPNGFRFPMLVPRDAARVEWPFYLDRRQRALLRDLHDAWGEDAVVQIYAGCVRIRSDFGDWRFSSDAELRAGIDMCTRLRQPAGRQENFTE